MILMRRGLWLLAALVLLASCSSNEEKKALEPLPLVEFENTVEVDRLWSTGLGGQAKKLYVTTTLGIADQTAYTADKDGVVYAVNLENGKVLWKRKTGLDLAPSASVQNGQVYFGGYNGLVIALSAEDGSELWRGEVTSEVIAAPQSNGSEVAVSSIDGSLTVFDASTGNKMWTYGHVVPPLTHRGLASPIVTSTQVIAAFDNGQILAFNANDGSSLWETRVAQPTGRHDLERIIDIDGTPLQNGGFLYAATFQGALAAIARAQGRIVWKQDISTAQPLAFANRRVFATAADGTVLAYNANTGAEEWKNDKMLRRGVGAPAILGDYVAVIDADGYMHLLSQETGEFAARISAKGKRFLSAPVSHEDKLLVLANNGTLSAYTLAD